MFKRKFLSKILFILVLSNLSLNMSGNINTVSAGQTPGIDNSSSVPFRKDQRIQALNSMIRYGLQFGPQHPANTYSYELRYSVNNEEKVPIQEENKVYCADQLSQTSQNSNGRDPRVNIYLVIKNTDGSEIDSQLYEGDEMFFSFKCEKLCLNPGDENYDIVDIHCRLYLAFTYASDVFQNEDEDNYTGIYRNFDIDNFLEYFDKLLEDDMERFFGLCTSEYDALD